MLFDRKKIIIISDSNITKSILTIWLYKEIPKLKIENYQIENFLKLTNINKRKIKLIIYDCDNECRISDENVKTYNEISKGSDIPFIVLSEQYPSTMLNTIKNILNFKFLFFKPFLKNDFIDKIKTLI